MEAARFWRLASFFRFNYYSSLANTFQSKGCLFLSWYQSTRAVCEPHQPPHYFTPFPHCCPRPRDYTHANEQRRREQFMYFGVDYYPEHWVFPRPLHTRMKIFMIVSWCLLAITSRGQNLIVNGSFELPTLSSNVITAGPGSTNLTGWKLGTNSNLYVIRGPVSGGFSAANGSQYVDLNRAVTVSQSIRTVPGEVYSVRFCVGRYQGLNMRVLASVSDSTGLVLTNVEIAAPSTQGWNPPTTFHFTAATGTSVLRFAETNSTANYDLTLDDVSVERITPRLVIEHLGIENSQVRLCWESRTNANYQLQYRSESIANIWPDIDQP